MMLNDSQDINLLHENAIQQSYGLDQKGMVPSDCGWDDHLDCHSF
jgi:hypothetical protein